MYWADRADLRMCCYIRLRVVCFLAGFTALSSGPPDQARARPTVDPGWQTAARLPEPDKRSAPARRNRCVARTAARRAAPTSRSGGIGPCRLDPTWGNADLRAALIGEFDLGGHRVNQRGPVAGLSNTCDSGRTANRGWTPPLRIGAIQSTVLSRTGGLKCRILCRFRPSIGVE